MTVLAGSCFLQILYLTFFCTVFYYSTFLPQLFCFCFLFFFSYRSYNTNSKLLPLNTREQKLNENFPGSSWEMTCITLCTCLPGRVLQYVFIGKTETYQTSKHIATCILRKKWLALRIALVTLLNTLVSCVIKHNMLWCTTEVRLFPCLLRWGWPCRIPALNWNSVFLRTALCIVKWQFCAWFSTDSDRKHV